MFIVLVWGSLAILCRKPITSGRVQLSKSSSLSLSKVVVISYSHTCLGVSKFIGVSCSRVEVLASPLMGPLMWWVLKVFRSSTTCMVEIVVCVGRLLILPSSSFYLAHLSLSLANILIFSLIFTWMTFIGVVFLSLRGEVLILSISTSWVMLSTFQERPCMYDYCTWS